jgi:type I restriction-modification system DNA methylase subunit
MFAEDRRLLPYRVNRTYTDNRSLGRHRDEIASRLDRVADGREDDYSKESTALWEDLRSVFDLVDHGHKTYGVPEYNGGLFDEEAHPFLAEKQLPDYYLARVIDQLGRAADPQQPGGGLFRVDYHDLAIQHLGTIYEGLLELHPRWASETMIVVQRREQGRVEERYLRASEPVPAGYARTDTVYPPTSIYLQTHKGERRATGSYYTPDHIVNHIVENTLGPLCRSLAGQLRGEIDAARRRGQAEEVTRLEHDFDRRVLDLRVLDPAMGSGHFLLRACQYLAEEIATSPNTSDSAAAGSGDEGTLSYWKRQVVEKCLYGVDLNSLAVELAKLALWLETVAANQPLSFLDHHLRHGNTLIGAAVDRMGALPGADVLQAGACAGLVRERLPELLKLLADIRRQSSETAGQVRHKGKVFRRFEQAREPFRRLADLHCSVYAEGEKPVLTDEQYRSAAERVASPRKFKALATEPWFKDALDRARRPDMHPFSWELEFPEVFFAGQDRHPNAGFDAIIGNPPYDVLSELETGADLTPLREAVADNAVYAPSRGGKNNLYKLFVCKALDLLADGGYLGFITPMAVLGDEQAAALRRQMVRVGRFAGIEAFPQKDDPKNRVFPEAKLSTAVILLVRDTAEGSDQRPFRARVHPGRFIEPTSPGLTLSTASVPLYDPANFTIVSCDQSDWDLAVRIVASGRMGRLKDYAEFFQGEVNETNERKKGTLTTDARKGKLVTRGASICLYVGRPASQGRDLFVDVDKFLRGKEPETKAFHFRQARVGLQESSPQNNFRRIIAAYVPKNEFCNHTVNYCPEHKCKIDLHLVLALLNSKMADWYFRIGSTNAHVSHYQLYNLPCPIFSDAPSAADEELKSGALAALEAGNLDQVAADLEPGLAQPPFRPAVRAVIVAAVQRIIELESDRGAIARVERSALAPAAQPYQDLIDRLLYRMAGLSDAEAAQLERRLAVML